MNSLLRGPDEHLDNVDKLNAYLKIEPSERSQELHCYERGYFGGGDLRFLNKLIIVALGVVVLTIGFNNCSSGFSSRASSIGASNNSSNNNNNSNNVPAMSGSVFFAQKVKPQFAARCNSCHIEGFQSGPAPITIFDYTSMKNLLKNGNGKYDNYLVNKVSNKAPLSHTGANQCPSGVTTSPCKEIADWWDAENLTGTNPPQSMALVGGIEFVSANGLLNGMSVDASRTNDIVTVSFYVNGPKDTGTLLGSVSADKQQFDPSYPNHAFSFQLPTIYLDGKNHNIYAYGRTSTVSDVLLKNTSFVAAAYPKSANWDSFFNSNIRATCTACHKLTAQQAYDMLANPTRAKGGTATTNDLIKTAANISFHSGGNRCGNLNQGVCTQMQNWWNQEFGPYPP